ncbi:hypothetical protein TNCV_4413161 [Trichonephila clavipes]|nr:hypothetical protein TNCV_4413161 [Trichonephila clavipes]
MEFLGRRRSSLDYHAIVEGMTEYYIMKPKVVIKAMLLLKPPVRARPTKFIAAKGQMCVCRYFEHHTGDSTCWFDSTSILRENTLGMVRGLPPTSREDLRLDFYLEHSHAVMGLFMPSP